MYRNRCYRGSIRGFFVVRDTASLEIITELMGPRKDYVMKGQEVVELTIKQNLSHMELPLC
jgi:hypothetical protein